MDATTKEFLEAVSKMRTLQKKYFTSRAQTLLNEAKAAEKEVDRLLAQLAPNSIAVRADMAEQTRLFE